VRTGRVTFLTVGMRSWKMKNDKISCDSKNKCIVPKCEFDYNRICNSCIRNKKRFPKDMIEDYFTKLQEGGY